MDLNPNIQTKLIKMINLPQIGLQFDISRSKISINAQDSKKNFQ
jgi:hypothetical protein